MHINENQIRAVTPHVVNLELLASQERGHLERIAALLEIAEPVTIVRPMNHADIDSASRQPTLRIRIEDSDNRDRAFDILAARDLPLYVYSSGAYGLVSDEQLVELDVAGINYTVERRSVG